ncbi:MAG TPA: hypothetical protein VFE47_12575 [Tepidisphaeraceae bacterium]|jgi:hypothetical protein|nr:hypothetical protein [Tepidisphaeraceae bacterium]
MSIETIEAKRPDHFYIGKGNAMSLWITFKRAAKEYDRSEPRIWALAQQYKLEKKKRWGKNFIRDEEIKNLLVLNEKYKGALSIKAVTDDPDFGFSKGFLIKYSTHEHPITGKKLEPGLVQVPGVGPSYLFYPGLPAKPQGGKTPASPATHLCELAEIRNQARLRRRAVLNGDSEYLNSLPELTMHEAEAAFGIYVFDIWRGRCCPYFDMKVFPARWGWVARAPDGNVVQAWLYKTTDLAQFADGYEKAIQNSAKGLWLEGGVDSPETRWRTYRIASEEYGVEDTWLLSMRNESCPDDGVLLPCKEVEFPTHHSPRHGRKDCNGKVPKRAKTWVYHEMELIEKQAIRKGWKKPNQRPHDHDLHDKIDLLRDVADKSLKLGEEDHDMALHDRADLSQILDDTTGMRAEIDDAKRRSIEQAENRKLLPPENNRFGPGLQFTIDGKTAQVTQTEFKLLKAVDAGPVSVQSVMRKGGAVWDYIYTADKKGSIQKAIRRLNDKLLEAGVPIELALENDEILSRPPT